MVTVEEKLTEEALRVKDCSNEIVDTLSKYFADDPGMAYTTMIFLIVRITSSMGINPEQVVFGLKQGFDTQKLLDAEVDSDWVN